MYKSTGERGCGTVGCRAKGGAGWRGLWLVAGMVLSLTAGSSWALAQACLEDGDCMDASFPYCVAGRCVQCTTTAECGAGQSCDEGYGVCVGDCSPSVGLSMDADVNGCQQEGQEVVFSATLGPFGPLACPVLGGQLTIALPDGTVCEHPELPEMVLLPGEMIVLQCPYVVNAADADADGVLVAVATWDNGAVGTFPPLPMLQQSPYPIKLAIDLEVDPPVAAISEGETGIEFCALPGGGSGAYDYLWDTGETTPCITTGVPGEHCVTVRDLNNGCEETACGILAGGQPGPSCLGDLNGDALVDAEDLAPLLGGWGPCQEDLCPGDIIADGTIDGSDLAALLGNWGPCAH